MRSSLLDFVAYSAIFAVSGFEHNCKRRKLKMFAQKQKSRAEARDSDSSTGRF
jgi:hypothetical protein